MMFQLCAVTLLLTLQGQGPTTSQDNAVVLDDYAPCGLTSLYLVCRIREVPTRWQEVKEALDAPGVGGELNFAQMAAGAEKLGLYPVALEAGRQALSDLPMPAIIQVHDYRFPDEIPHFLVLLRPERDGVWLLDAPFPAYFLSEDRFKQSWTGKVMVFAEDQEQADYLRGTAKKSELAKSAAWLLLVGGLLSIAYVAITRFIDLLGHKSIQFIGKGLGLRALWLGNGRKYLLAPTLIVVFLLVGGLAAMVLRQHTRKSAAQCSFSEAVVELGELKPGGQNIQVRIRNQGEEALQITEIQSSCSCAVAKHPDTLLPLENGDIEVELNIRPGPGGAYLTVVSNDPAGPKHVSLRWHGKTEPFLNPRWITETGVPLNHPYEKTVKVLYPGGKSALVPELESSECADSSVRVQAGKNDALAIKLATSGLLTQIQGELELHLTVRPPRVAGTLETICWLRIKYGEAHLTVALPIVLAFSGGELTPSATGVTFAAANRADLLSQVRTITVKDLAREAGLEIAGVPDWLTCKVERKTDQENLIHLQLLKPPGEEFVKKILRIERKQGAKATIGIQVIVLAPSL